jgi:hypothetical protein
VRIAFWLNFAVNHRLVFYYTMQPFNAQ